MKRMLMSVFALVVFAAPVAAQSEWLAGEGTSVALEYRHPSLPDVDGEEDVDASMLNGAYFLSGRIGVPMIGIAAVAEIPFAYGKFGSGEAEQSGTAIGNIYIGGEMPLMMGLATLTGGLRLPTAPEADEDNGGALMVGTLGGLTDRGDAFVEGALVPQIGVRVGIPGIPVFDVEANLNANYVMAGGEDVEGEEEDDNEFVLDGGLRAFAAVMGLRAGVGFEGATNLSQDDEEEGDSSMYHAGLWADHAFGMFRPGVSFFIPLSSDYSDAVDWTLGISLEINLPM